MRFIDMTPAKHLLGSVAVLPGVPCSLLSLFSPMHKTMARYHYASGLAMVSLVLLNPLLFQLLTCFIPRATISPVPPAVTDNQMDGDSSKYRGSFPAPSRYRVGRAPGSDGCDGWDLDGKLANAAIMLRPLLFGVLAGTSINKTDEFYE